MLNGLRGLVSWLNALLSIETTRELAEEAYDHTIHEHARRARREHARKKNSERNSALFQNLLVTAIPEVIKAFSQHSSPAPKPTLFPTAGLDNDRPVTVHRRKPSMEEVPRVDLHKEPEVKGEDFLMSLDERLRIVEMILSERPCIIADTDSILNRHRAPGAVGVKVIRADQFAEWAKGFVDSLKVQRAAAAPGEECTPVDTSSTCEEKLD